MTARSRNGTGGGASVRRVVRASSAFLVAAGLVLGAASVAYGAGGAMGIDHYLLSNDGKLIRQLDAHDRESLDLKAELYYRPALSALSAFRFDNSQAWTVKLEGMKGIIPWARAVPQVVLAMSAEEMVGLSKSDGRELYRVSLAESRSPVGSWFPQEDDTGPDAGFAYLAYQNTEIVHRKGDRGVTWMEKVAVTAAVVVKIDLENGKKLWRRELNLPDKEAPVRRIEPGIIRGESSRSVCRFDRGTGEVLPPGGGGGPGSEPGPAPKGAEGGSGSPGPAARRAIHLPEGVRLLLEYDDTVLVAETKPLKEGGAKSREREIAVVALSAKDQSERWRWRVPQAPPVYDYVEVAARRCPSGLLVTRTWTRLD